MVRDHWVITMKTRKSGRAAIWNNLGLHVLADRCSRSDVRRKDWWRFEKVTPGLHVAPFNVQLQEAWYHRSHMAAKMARIANRVAGWI
jgi:hypothetical protein